MEKGNAMFGAANPREVIGMDSLQAALRQYEGPTPSECSSCRRDPRMKGYYHYDEETNVTTYGCCPDSVGLRAGVGRNDVKRAGFDSWLWDSAN